MLRIVPSIIYNVKVNKKGKYETHQKLFIAIFDETRLVAFHIQYNKENYNNLTSLSHLNRIRKLRDDGHQSGPHRGFHRIKR
jgi:hypothetical protein